MTIEIHQLIIRAVVHETKAAARASQGAHDTGPSPSAPRERVLPDEERQSLIAACVREVVRRLERSRER